MRTYPKSYPSKTGMSPVTAVNGGEWKSQKCLIHGHKCARRTMVVHEVVPVEGLEPPFLAERDFESRASTGSATRA